MFITYKESLNGFDQNVQDQILSLAIQSWNKMEFQTLVLRREHAESHILYKELLNASKKHCKITKDTPEHILKKRQFHSEASIIRWLAFANSKAKNFFFGDYDIFNINLSPKEFNYKNLTFLDGQCLCFSFAESWQWCEFLAELFIKNIDVMTNWNEPHVFYHDQDLVVNLYKKDNDFFSDKNIFFEKKIVRQPTNEVVPENCKILHISHSSCKFASIDVETARLNIAKKIIHCTLS
jgi:hypothetical protein